MIFLYTDKNKECNYIFYYNWFYRRKVRKKAITTWEVSRIYWQGLGLAETAVQFTNRPKTKKKFKSLKILELENQIHENLGESLIFLWVFMF